MMMKENNYFLQKSMYFQTVNNPHKTLTEKRDTEKKKVSLAFHTPDYTSNLFLTFSF